MDFDTVVGPIGGCSTRDYRPLFRRNREKQHRFRMSHHPYTPSYRLGGEVTDQIKTLNPLPIATNEPIIWGGGDVADCQNN
ncbi:uncharacterized protein LOC121588231 isoform X2 [Anopheles merus]|uniref:uncharacterized protein LOC121588231 isoform X2 n=1 Tax=Anopheles merus TaxID=30066 RepID=UPI001BE4E184|nr:uncharacterized protein LOC121588231 isoform X2 [Anopheles merus]